MRKSILALTIAAFGIGTTEFIIMGLLPNLAHDFHVSIPKAGILVSGYALSVTIGSPLVALATLRIQEHSETPIPNFRRVRGGKVAASLTSAYV